MREINKLVNRDQFRCKHNIILDRFVSFFDASKTSNIKCHILFRLGSPLAAHEILLVRTLLPK